jgi:hypothetical protein
MTKEKSKSKSKKPELMLTATEMVRYENASLQIRINQLETKIIDLRKSNFEIAKENSDLQIKLCGLEKYEKVRALGDFRAAHTKFNEDTCRRLELDNNRFGYDPVTGIVIPSEKGEIDE